MRTFRAAVSGSFFTRLGIGGLPFLLPLLYQVGMGFTPVQSGALMIPQTFAAMSLKLTSRSCWRGLATGTSSSPTRWRWVRSSCCLRRSGQGTPVWLIVVQVFCFGFFTSLQYTSMNTLVYADVDERSASSASTIASTGQQMSISFGVATASLATAFFVPDRFNSNATEITHGIHQALIALGVLTIVSTVIFVRLKRDDGNSVSQHRTELPAAE